ncbi:MAG TPA: hypothetical protein VGB64_02285 [Actinomycetota bacterium]
MGGTIHALGVWSRARRRLHTGEESGFSMMEVAVTIGIIAMLVVSMTAALGNGFKYLLISKQRAAATQAASAVLERARAVSQNDWTALGLVSSDLTGDANIASGLCSGVSTEMFSGEPIVKAGSTSANPLYPHVATVPVGSTTVTVKTYVTGITASGGCSVSNHAYKRVTVLATWANTQPGTSSSIRLATYLSPVTRPSNPDFSGTASYSGSSLIGNFTAIGSSLQDTAIYPPQSAADGRSVGQVVTYRGTGISALGSVAGASTAQHTASSTVDDDSLTAGIAKHSCDPTSCQPPTPPNCSTFNDSNTWSDFFGGMVGTLMQGSAGSCSSVADASDGLPYTKNRSALATTLTMKGTVPAGGVLPSFLVDLMEVTSGWTSTSTVDRSVTSSQARIASTASTTLTTMPMLRFNAAGILNANRGVIEFAGGTFTSTANAGVGAAAPSASGTVSFAVLDPNAILTGCASRNGIYCNVVVDPHAAGFSGYDRTFDVVYDYPSLLPVARFIMSTNVKVFAPSKTQSAASGSTTQATMSYSLPKITSSLIVQAPVGTTLATATDTMDFGQLVTAAFYTPPGS